MSQVETPLYDVHMKGGRILCLCKILSVMVPNTLRTVRMSVAHGLDSPVRMNGKFLRELVDLARTLRLNKHFEVLDDFVCVAVEWLTLESLQGVEREKYGILSSKRLRPYCFSFKYVLIIINPLHYVPPV